MSFNKHALSRLAAVAGVNRVGNDVQPYISTLIEDYLVRVMRGIISLLHFADHKVIHLADITLLHKISPTIVPHILYANIYSNKSETYSTRKPFSKLVRDIGRGMDEHIQFGKNVIPALQSLIEKLLIALFQRAKEFAQNRKTVYAQDISHVRGLFL